MDWKVIIVGAIVLVVLVAIGAVSIPTEVKISTNQSSQTYNLSSLPDQGITPTNLIGLVIIVLLSIIIFYWAVK